MTSDSWHLLEFGHFELDPRAATLTRDGVPLHLPPQQYAVLNVLASRAGELVTRDELRRLLWGDDQFVDYAAGLNFCVGQLRQALGDRAAEPVFIQTVPRRGYRFIAPVVRVKAPEPAVSMTATPPVPPGDEAVQTALPDGPAVESAARTVVTVEAPAASRLAVVATESRTLGLRLRPAIVVAAAALAGVLIGGAGARLSMPTGDEIAPAPSALRAYERARHGLESTRPFELRERVLLFQQAVAESPDFADAFGGLALAHTIAASTQFAPAEDAYARARNAARRALAVDARNVDAHAALGLDAMYARWDWVAADAHLDAALALDARHVTALSASSLRHSGLGRHAEAIALARRAVDASPPTAARTRLTLAWAHIFAGEYTTAVQVCTDVESDPDAAEGAALCLLNALTELDRGDDAHAALRRLAAAAGASDHALARLDRLYRDRGLEGLWQWRLDDLRARLAPSPRRTPSEALALFHARLGQADEAMRHLREAVAGRSPLAVVVRVHPGLQTLRADARFAELLRQLRVGGLREDVKK